MLAVLRVRNPAAFCGAGDERKEDVAQELYRYKLQMTLRLCPRVRAIQSWD